MSTPVIIMKPEGRFTNHDLELLLSEMREFVMREKEVMHVKEVAALLGVTERTVYTTVPSHKVPGLGRVYLRSEIIDYIKKH